MSRHLDSSVGRQKGIWRTHPTLWQGFHRNLMEVVPERGQSAYRLLLQWRINLGFGVVVEWVCCLFWIPWHIAHITLPTFWSASPCLNSGFSVYMRCLFWWFRGAFKTFCGSSGVIHQQVASVWEVGNFWRNQFFRSISGTVVHLWGWCDPHSICSA